jgi:hypothetical protein
MWNGVRSFLGSGNMTIARGYGVASVGAIVILALTLMQGQEKKITRSNLPPKVEKAVAGQSQGATVRGFSQEKEKGQTFYEVELTVDGLSKDVLLDRNGVIVEVEEEVSPESLSPAVQAGLQGRAGHGKLVKVESLIKKGKLVAYEAQVLTNGKKSEVQVAPDGAVLDHEE